MEELSLGRKRLKEVRVSPSSREEVKRLGLGELKNGASLEELLSRPDVCIEDLLFLDETLAALSPEILEQLQIGTKYEGYIRRQLDQVERFRRTEKVTISPDFDYNTVSGLSSEVREKLKKVRPLTLGQASRISGVTPAAIAILAVLLRRG
jgi:tRNA uridine 5-carboxymethylaminomethyl modification enzyme